MKNYRINYLSLGSTSIVPLWFYTEANSEFAAIHNFELEAAKCATKITRVRTEEITPSNSWKNRWKTPENTNKLECTYTTAQIQTS